MDCKRLLLGLVLALVAVGCTVRIPLDSLAEDLRGNDVRTMSMYEGFTLVSPYDPIRTAQIGRVVSEELGAITSLFGITVDEPIFVELRPVPMDDVEVEAMPGGHYQLVGDVRPPTHHGVAGAAGSLQSTGRSAVIIYVAEDRDVQTTDGRVVPIRLDFCYRDTIRHELAHIAHHLLGIETDETWLSEGIAVTVEAMEMHSGRLRHVELPKELLFAMQVHRKHSLNDLLRWRENIAEIVADESRVFREGRPLAMSLVRFVIETRPDLTFPEAIRYLASLQRSEIASLDARWHAWLDSLDGRWARSIGHDG